jgi:hypothetical protein
MCRYPWVAKEILEDVKNKYVSYYFFQFEPIFKEKRTPEEETEVVNDLLLSMGFDEGGGKHHHSNNSDLKKNLLGDSAGPDNEANNGSIYRRGDPW